MVLRAKLPCLSICFTLLWETLNYSHREDEAEGQGLQGGGEGEAVVAASKESSLDLCHESPSNVNLGDL